jgi:hypothetical protein
VLTLIPAENRFGAGEIYTIVPIALAIGCFLPVPFFLAWKFMPAQFTKTRTALRTLNTAIITQYSCYMSVGINSVSPILQQFDRLNGNSN